MSSLLYATHLAASKKIFVREIICKDFFNDLFHKTSIRKWEDFFLSHYVSFITCGDAQKYDRRTEKKGETEVMEKQPIIVASFAVNGEILVFKIFFLTDIFLPASLYSFTNSSFKNVIETDYIRSLTLFLFFSNDNIYFLLVKKSVSLTFSVCIFFFLFLCRFFSFVPELLVVTITRIVYVYSWQRRTI